MGRGGGGWGGGGCVGGGGEGVSGCGSDGVMAKSAWAKLNREIVACERCCRLREHCSEVARVKRGAYAGETYWGRPVPNFGPEEASGKLLIVGLAPGAHGANRTGRVFTGDRSG